MAGGKKILGGKKTSGILEFKVKWCRYSHKKGSLRSDSLCRCACAQVVFSVGHVVDRKLQSDVTHKHENKQGFKMIISSNKEMRSVRYITYMLLLAQVTMGHEYGTMGRWAGFNSDSKKQHFFWRTSVSRQSVHTTENCCLVEKQFQSETFLTAI